MIRTAAGLIMSIMLLFSLSAGCSSKGENNLKVYAVKYGKSEFPRKFIYYGDNTADKLPFTWLFYYIEFRDRRILVDTGFNNEKLRRMFDISDFRNPVDILKENGIGPETITDVIITHSHFDHIGTLNNYVNARIIINKKEFSSFMKGNGLNEVREFLKDNSDVYTFEESITLFDFFRIQKVGGHSVGSSVIIFKHGETEYCLTGDEAYTEDNITNLKGNGSVVSHSNNIRFLKELNKSGAKPLIFHDNRYYNEPGNMIQVIPSRQ